MKLADPESPESWAIRGTCDTASLGCRNQRLSAIRGVDVAGGRYGEFGAVGGLLGSVANGSMVPCQVQGGTMVLPGSQEGAVAILISANAYTSRSKLHLKPHQSHTKATPMRP